MFFRRFLRSSIINSVAFTSSRQSIFHAGSSLHYSSLLVPISNNLNRSFRHFSSNWGSGGDDKQVSDPWKLTTDDSESAVFPSEQGDLSGISDDISTRQPFHKDEDDEWLTAEGYKPWSFDQEAQEDDMKLFDVGAKPMEALTLVDEQAEQENKLKYQALVKEEQELMDKLKGPNRAFGDLIAASGITDAMLDSLILLKELEGVEGLPSLTDIEDMRLAKAERKSTRAEIERKKQEETAKTYVRQVDEKGRAYGTGRRKCSVARVWIQPGDGKFIINDREFDVYFPILDNRAALLRPFVETKTLGLWDVNCTVKGGGVSGQVGAIRLGVSRALQNWEPGFRPYLRSAGFLTRDPRVVERKKPGKAKARKSFQWVKR